MASVLSALGITGVSAPDPSAYKNIQLESSNLGEAKSGMKGTISNIDMALSGADLIGLPPSYTSSIKSLRDGYETAARTTPGRSCSISYSCERYDIYACRCR